MKFTKEQKRKIVQELDPGMENGILFRLFDDLRDIFRGFQDNKRYIHGGEFTADVEELLEFTRGIAAFDPNASIYSKMANRLDTYCLCDEETGDYFDFNRDVIPILQVIQEHIVYHGNLLVDLEMVYRDLRKATDRYIEKKLGIMPAYYHYEKDHYGTEKCYYVGDFIQDDQEETLNKLCNDGIPVEEIYLTDWNNMQRDDDEENEFIQAKHKAIREALEEGMYFPMLLITHFHDNLKNKYEVIQQEDDIDYAELIHEYAEPKAYKIEPTFIRGTEITRQQAIERGMYALAQEIELNEVFTEEKDDTEE